MEPQIPPHWNGRDQRNFQSLFLIGRLGEGVSRDQANAAVNVLYKRFLQDLAGPQPSADVRQRMNALVELTPAGKGIDGVRRDFALPLRVLMVVVAIILLIACANVANLLLARAAVRNREIVLRLALGARRISLIRQFITESLILALIAGAAGVLLAWWGTHLLVAMASSGPRPLPLDVTLNYRVLGFTLLVSIVSAVIFGTAPALRATRGDLNSTLKDGKGAVRPSTQNRLGRSLVVAQVALSLMLMIGAGLFVRTLRNLEDIPTGFNAQNVALFNIDTASLGYDDEQITKLQVEAEDRVKQIPGVEAASFSFLTFNQGGWTSPLFTRDETPPQGEARVVRQNVVGEDYFKAMDVQLVSGRGFNRFDTAQSQKVAVVSESMAQHFYPNTSPLGKHFGKRAEFPDAVEIIGVVKDVKYQSLTEDSRPLVYFPLTQMPQPVNIFVVRVSSDSVIPAVRQTLRSFNSNLPIDDVVSLEEHVSRSLAQQKLIARVASFFGLLALVLASIGLYGVLAYAVAQRRNEIGIRVALGASSADVLKLVLRNGMTMTVIGLVLGVGGALALTRLVATLLFGVTPTDLLTFVGVSLTLVVVALLACYIPARMATQVDPLTALRDE
jgi:predicted permease